MVDSIRVFDPGFVVLDQNGLVVSGAQIKFYTAGTTTPLTVYSDSTLATSLGSTVTCDAYGRPASGTGTDVLIYTGTAAYKITFSTSGGTLIPGLSFDNVRGALDTSTFGAAATITFPVVAVSATGSASANMSKVENTNPTAGQIIRTLPTAASVGNGAFIIARHDGTANATLYVSQGSDLIHTRGDLGSQQTLVLFGKGDSAILYCDGVDFHAVHSPAISQNRYWKILAIQTAPPSSPVAGDSYIITGSPTGAWSTFAANDIVTSNGNAGWIRSRPSTDCGWLAYVVSSQTYTRYIGSAWRSEAAADTTYGTVTIATAAETKAGSITSAALTPGRLQNHPATVKAWITFNGTGTIAISESYNVSSITDNGVGDYTINFTTAFATATYALAGSARQGSAPYVCGAGTSNTTTASRIRVIDGGVGADVAFVSAMFAGNQ